MNNFDQLLLRSADVLEGIVLVGEEGDPMPVVVDFVEIPAGVIPIVHTESGNAQAIRGQYSSRDAAVVELKKRGLNFVELDQ